MQTGDVREGRWSDTWSDRRRRDAQSESGGREDRGERPGAAAAPPLPDTIAASALDAAARRDLGGLQKDLAEAVARHLVAAGTLVDDDPHAALAHARYARRRASRIAVVREAAGITAYHAGEWAEALAELRAARRMGGGPGHLPVMADIERAMGRPERAIELARGPEARELGRSAQIELAIVVAGARKDLGELDAAVVALQVPELESSRRDPWSARLFYAYADNLLAAGRDSDALQWFVHAADADTDGQTDADSRIAELTGEPLPDDGIEFALDEEYVADEPDIADTTADDPAEATADDAPGATVDDAAEATADNAPEATADADAPVADLAAATTQDTAHAMADAAPDPADHSRAAPDHPIGDGADDESDDPTEAAAEGPTDGAAASKPPTACTDNRTDSTGGRAESEVEDAPSMPDNGLTDPETVLDGRTEPDPATGSAATPPDPAWAGRGAEPR